MKKIYDFDEMMMTIEQAEELNLPYKLVRTVEPQFNEMTDQTVIVRVWLFRFL
jgi:hypothetical protein